MNTNIKTREYTTVAEVAGPLMIVEDVEGVAYSEIVDIETLQEKKEKEKYWKLKVTWLLSRYLKVPEDLNISTTKVRFTGETAHIGVSWICWEEYSMVQATP